MRKIIALGLLVLVSFPVMAASEKIHDFEAGFVSSHYSYRYPKVSYPVEKKGTLSGVRLGYTHHRLMENYFNSENDIFLKLEGTYLSGKVDQNGLLIDGNWDESTDESIKDVKQRIWDVRLLGGEAYPFKDGALLLSLYMGLGYRYVNDKVPSTNLTAFNFWYKSDQKIKWFYMPLGGDLTVNIAEGMKIKVGGEFDLLIHGKHVSDTSNYPQPPFTYGGVTYDELHNMSAGQHGFGVRVNARLEMDYKRLGIFIEPFYQYWRISRSEEAWIYGTSQPDANNTYYYLYDRIPFNITKEYGLRAGITF